MGKVILTVYKEGRRLGQTEVTGLSVSTIKGMVIVKHMEGKTCKLERIEVRR